MSKRLTAKQRQTVQALEAFLNEQLPRTHGCVVIAWNHLNVRDDMVHVCREPKPELITALHELLAHLEGRSVPGSIRVQ